MKRIVICADGTWNHRDQVVGKAGRRHPSNVTKVARGVMARDATGVDQVVLYHEGVGTGGGLDRWTGGAFGRGLEANIRQLYRFIIYNHEPGDELFFFGFSRGAFTVRTLAGFMSKVGLAEKNGDYYVPELYACYEKGLAPGDPTWDRIAGKVKAQACPPIKFIGVWDTVGALGAPGFLGQWLHSGKYRYHDVALNGAIQNAAQALAIDERRKPFLPSIWTRPTDWQGELQQAWFPGVHTNVGGGYEFDGVANEALHWIVEKAHALGLAFDEEYLGYFRPCFNSDLYDSMSLAYRVFGNGVRRLGNHRGDREALHQAAVDRSAYGPCAYTPRNLRDYLPTGATPLPVVTTDRVERGKPCEGGPFGA